MGEGQNKWEKVGEGRRGSEKVGEGGRRIEVGDGMEGWRRPSPDRCGGVAQEDKDSRSRHRISSGRHLIPRIKGMAMAGTVAVRGGSKQETRRSDEVRIWDEVRQRPQKAREIRVAAIQSVHRPVRLGSKAERIVNSPDGAPLAQTAMKPVQVCA